MADASTLDRWIDGAIDSLIDVAWWARRLTLFAVEVAGICEEHRLEVLALTARSEKELKESIARNEDRVVGVMGKPSLYAQESASPSSMLLQLEALALQTRQLRRGAPVKIECSANMHEVIVQQFEADDTPKRSLLFEPAAIPLVVRFEWPEDLVVVRREDAPDDTYIHNNGKLYKLRRPDEVLIFG